MPLWVGYSGVLAGSGRCFFHQSLRPRPLRLAHSFDSAAARSSGDLVSRYMRWPNGAEPRRSEDFSSSMFMALTLGVTGAWAETPGIVVISIDRFYLSIGHFLIDGN